MGLFKTAFLKLKGLISRLKTGEPHHFVLEPSTVWFLEMEDALFHHNSAVLMPSATTASAGDQGVEVPAVAQVDGLDLLKTCIVQAETNPKQLVLVTGHADTSGDIAYNVELSEMRAQNVLAALLGKRDDWVAIAEKKHKVEDYKQILKWVAKVKTFPCDPGPVNNVKDNATTTATKNFQTHYNKAYGKSIKEDGIVGKETWGAFFDIYEEQLIVRLFMEPDKLKQIRDNLQYLDGGKKAVGCGEHFPIEQENRDSFRSQQNRRVEVLFFDPDEKPKLDCHPGPKKCEFKLCQIFDENRVTRVPIPVIPTPPPAPVSIEIEEIQTTQPGGSGFHSDDDFAPLLGEKAKIIVEVSNLRDGFQGKLQMEIGRLTNTPDDPSTPEQNESFVVAATLEKDFTMGRVPALVEFEWNGKATQDQAIQLSNRQTPDHNNGGALQNIPVARIENGKNVPHGLYLIGSIRVLRGTNPVARRRIDDVFISVPFAANVVFKAAWSTALAAYGLSPFKASLEESLRRYIGRDYMIRHATLTNRMNARVITDTGKTKSDCLLVDVEGQDASGEGLFGVSAFVSASQQENIYVTADVLAHPTLDRVHIYPITFLWFNNHDIAAGDRTAFRAAFSPLGVKPSQTDDAPGSPDARTVTGGTVRGATNATDFGNVSITIHEDGIATITSRNTTVVPAARATDIQRAYNTFIRMVGNTTSHEIGHALGIAAPNNAQNQVTVGTTNLRTPLPDDASFHNPVAERANPNIMDRGGTRSFQRRVEASGNPRQVFSARNARYLRDCIPFAPADH